MSSDSVKMYTQIGSGGSAGVFSPHFQVFLFVEVLGECDAPTILLGGTQHNGRISRRRPGSCRRENLLVISRGEKTQEIGTFLKIVKSLIYIVSSISYTVLWKRHGT